MRSANAYDETISGIHAIWASEKLSAEAKLRYIGRMCDFETGETALVNENTGTETSGQDITEKKPRTRAAKKPRAPRGSRRSDLVTLLRQHPDGMTRGDILEAWGLKADKAGAMSVSNALTASVKAGQIRREDGKYYAAAETAEQEPRTGTHG